MRKMFTLTINLIILALGSIHSLPVVRFTDFHASLTNATRLPLIPLNHTLLTNQLTHIDLPKYITEPSSNLQALSSSRGSGSSSFINPPGASQSLPHTHHPKYPPRVSSAGHRGHHLNQPYPNNRNHNQQRNRQAPPRKEIYQPNYALSSSNNVNLNHPINSYNSRSAKKRNPRNDRLRSPVPQPAPPLEKTGYDYDYDTHNYDDILGEVREVGASQYEKSSLTPRYQSSDGSKLMLSPKISMYKSKIDALHEKEKGDLRSRGSSHRSENWTTPGGKVRSPQKSRRTSESSRSNNYSRRGHSHDNSRSYPLEYYYPESSYDDYNSHHPHHHHHHHHPTSPRASSRPHRVQSHSPSHLHDDYNVETFDNPPSKASDASYTDTSDPSDSFYDKESPGETDDTDGESIDDETGNPDSSEMEPENTLTDDTGDAGSHSEETLDDDDTKEVRSQTLYASGSDEIPDDMRLPYHNAPVDEHEIASDRFLSSREYSADALVDTAKQRDSTK